MVSRPPFPECPITHLYCMDNYPPGTRVVFWEDAGKIKHGFVQGVDFVDGVEVAYIVVDGHTRAPVKVPLNALSREG